MNLEENLSALSTEKTNEDTINIDVVSTLDMVRMINHEDQKVALAVEAALPQIAQAVDCIAAALAAGGRLVYSGAGTSGRLGVLDASEVVPTFGVPNTEVLGLIAGGAGAVVEPVEGAEDDSVAGAGDLRAIGFAKPDILVGIAASGRTPYVIGAMDYARGLGATVVAVSCVAGAVISGHADVAIEVVTGPEAISGSTRMKAGTAQKMVLNMLSTGAMVKIGKVYRNLMIDVVSTNEKLVERAIRIVREATGASREEAQAALEQAGNRAKLAVMIIKTGLGAAECEKRLAAAKGHLRAALQGTGGADHA